MFKKMFISAILVATSLLQSTGSDWFFVSGLPVFQQERSAVAATFGNDERPGRPVGAPAAPVTVAAAQPQRESQRSTLPACSGSELGIEDSRKSHTTFAGSALSKPE